MDDSNNPSDKEGQNIYEVLFNSSLDALMTLEPPTWNFTSGNPAAVEVFGAKDKKDFLSHAPWNYSPKTQPDGTPSDVKAKEMIMKALKEGGASFEWVHKRLDGEEFFANVLLTKTSINGKDALQATVRDISKLKKTEELLKEKVEELEKFQKIITDRELKMIDLKEEIKRLKGDS
ncbi:MAG: PAS domain S-box protein [Candidatus Jacksonbacteria bacterium]|jgi:PAS domain S-box-containing protein|nr:PAS domain S-box protein [Candidatus Jacksonbacteria bacterium]MBT6757506.1 PAS domain S-box protein [Candidatus Jacksonbacteria bacterium]MBT7007883.1 PAS domain S-box protein [Candidatus Jacksonbacteria bacterium]